MHKTLDKLLDITYPIIVAPMFLVSNTKMTLAALEVGATAAIPALNYRTDSQLRNAIEEIKSKSNKPFGINLIVNKSNPKYKSQLQTIVELGVDFVITSLGNPKETIEACKAKGIKVFCDIVNIEQAKKVEALGADAIIAVNNKAGGHCGPIEKKKLLKELIKKCNIPVISAGGNGTKEEFQETMALGASGASIGTLFLAAQEADISEEYRQALIDYKAKDIVLTKRLSGSNLTVINTPYLKELGTKATIWEILMKKNKWLRKYGKMFLGYRTMKTMIKAANKATYKTVWCAGPSIEHIHKIRPLKEIIGDLVD